MRVIRVLLLFSVLLAWRSDAAQQQPIKIVATVLQLHEAMITPSSDALFDVGRKAPENDQEWVVLRNNAIVLAESGNLLMLGNRAQDIGPWMKMSRALVDAGVVALKATETKSVDALLKADDQIDSACESCHVPYRDHGRMMR